jgi:hypothetical protein
LASLADLNLHSSSTLLRGPNAWTSHGDRCSLYGEWSTTFQHIGDELPCIASVT